MKHTLVVLVENHPGVLTRVAGLFSRRGFNIESLAVGPTHQPGLSRMTIVLDGSERIVEQVCKQLNKLINVIKVSQLNAASSVDRELALIKVQADAARQPEVIRIADIFRAKIIDVGARSLVIEATGDEQKMEAIIGLLRQYGIMALARTGVIAMERGPQDLCPTTKTYEEESADAGDLLRPGRPSRAAART